MNHLQLRAHLLKSLSRETAKKVPTLQFTKRTTYCVPEYLLVALLNLCDPTCIYTVDIRVYRILQNAIFCI
jgi:hypothetical protein